MKALVLFSVLLFFNNNSYAKTFECTVDFQRLSNPAITAEQRQSDIERMSQNPETAFKISTARVTYSEKLDWYLPKVVVGWGIGYGGIACKTSQNRGYELIAAFDFGYVFFLNTDPVTEKSLLYGGYRLEFEADNEEHLREVLTPYASGELPLFR